MTFSGSKLRDIRERAGQSREQVAVALDVSSATIGNWERGVYVPDANDVKALGTCLGVPTDDFYEAAA